MPSSPGPTPYSQTTMRFNYRGVSLLPQDNLGEGKFALGINIRSYQEGTVQPRYGLCEVTSPSAGSAVHSIFRLNDTLQGSAGDPETRLFGAGSDLNRQVVGNAAWATIDSGYSGFPMTAVTASPFTSPEPWVYLGDFSRARKVNSAGQPRTIGLPQPTVPPSITLDAVQSTFLESINPGSPTWTAYGSPSNVSPSGLATVQDRINTVVNAIIYDSGATGMCSISLSDMSAVTVGATIDIGASPETIIVQEINPAVSITTIAGIIYDVGTSGFCTIQPTGSFAMGQIEVMLPEQVRRRYEDLNIPVPPQITITRTVDFPVNCLVMIGGVELVRILSVAIGPDGVQSFRCFLAGTYAAGASIVGIPAFRGYLNTTKSNGDPAVASCVFNEITPVADDEPIVAGIQVAVSGGNRNWALVGNRATQPEDIISFSIRVDQILFVKYVRIMLSLDADTATAGQEFLRNYFQYEWRENDLLEAIQPSPSDDPSATDSLLEGQEQAVDHGQVAAFYGREFGEDPLIVGGGNPDAPLVAAPKQQGRTDGFVSVGSVTARQLAMGNAQWITLHCKVSDLTRIGTRDDLTLADVKAAAIVLQILGTTDPIQVQYSDCYLQGGYGPDVGPTNPPYVYRYRYRSTLTGERSNPSPPTRAGVTPRRGRVLVTATASAEPQCDVIDWFRFGGSLARWAYVRTVPNTSPTSQPDDMADRQIDGGEGLRDDLYQPFPTADIPRAGTCNVAGTAVQWVSGDQFNTNWAAGSTVIVNGRTTSLYRSPTSATFMEVVDNCDSGTGVQFSMPDPILKATPLPSLWGGPVNDVWFNFGCGDLNDPGTIHWTHGNDPDTTSLRNTLVVSSASEPLVNGCFYDGVPYVFSSERLYRLIPSFGEITAFRAVETACTKGLWGRTAMTVGADGIYFLSKDGIYRTQGGSEAEPITIPDLQPLFPQDGTQPESIRGLAPVDYCDSVKLTWVDQILYVDYQDLAGNPQTMLYEPLYKRWTFDFYALSGVRTRIAEPGANVHTNVIGCLNGQIYQLDSSQICDVSTPIDYTFWTAWPTAEDLRGLKQWGDAAIDVNPAGSVSGITVTPVSENGNLAATVVGVNGIVRQTFIIDVNNGAGVLSQNFGLQVTGSVEPTDLQRPLFYWWQAASLYKQPIIARRMTDWEDLGYKGAKFIQGVVLRANTFNVPKSLEVQYDGGTVALSLTLTHNGEETKAYPLDSAGWTPFVAELVRLAGADDEDWTLLDWRFIFEPAPELATQWETQETTFDFPGYGCVHDAVLAYQSTAGSTLRVWHDAGFEDYALPSTGGVYQRVYVIFKAKKGRSFKFQWRSSNPFRVFERDVTVRTQGWGLPGGYQMARPFGGPSRVVGAEI